MFKEWIDRISKPSVLLGGLSVCPFAKGADYSVHKTDGSNINPPAGDFELIIYHLPDSYSEEKVINIANKHNLIYKDMVFLPDPKDRYTEINGVQTNNGVHNIILCQRRVNLDNARTKLQKTPYYTYWANEYLKEILES